ncbi:MAG: hypothetical protein M3198_01015 [Actinomycetota bacterium]|nr:hypothetical protein [Actinomycetota bacterium]
MPLRTLLSSLLSPPARTLRVGASLCLLLALGACSDPAASDKPAKGAQVCATDAPITGAELHKLPQALSLQKWGIVTKVTERAGFVGAELVSEMKIVELYPVISRAVEGGGYETISGENEGFEAELFFQKGRNTGTFLLREGPCKGQVTVKLIYGAAKGAPQGGGG